MQLRSSSDYGYINLTVGSFVMIRSDYAIAAIVSQYDHRSRVYAIRRKSNIARLPERLSDRGRASANQRGGESEFLHVSAIHCE
jgi:hypothetical protein